MEQSSSEQFRALFGPLSAVQTVELGVVVKGQLPKELPTQLNVGYNAKITTRENGDALLVTVRFDASASQDGTEIFSGRCQVVGIWPMIRPRVLSDEAVAALGSQFAAPTIFAVARQNLGDVLNKVGIHPDKWPWHIGHFEPLEQPAKSDEGAGSRKRPKAKRK